MPVTLVKDRERTPRFIDPNSALSKQVETLIDLIKNPPENSRIISFSPALADWILTEKNSKNRKLKPARIKRYAEAMENGDWRLTGETIIFGKSGLLLDGQNRFAASLRSQKKFRTHVVFGIDDAVFTTINTAKARTPSDTFYRAGVLRSEIISPAIRWLIIYANGNPKDRSTFSNDVMWSFFQENVNKDRLSLVAEWASKTNKVIPRGALAAHLYMFDKKNQMLTKKFADDLIRNPRGSGARALIGKLRKAKEENFGRLNDIWINALIVQTWNGYRSGHGVTRNDLRWNTQADEYPAIT